MATITKLKGKFKGDDKKAEKESLKNIKQANKQFLKHSNPKEDNHLTQSKSGRVKSVNLKVQAPKKLTKAMQQERTPKFQKSI